MQSPARTLLADVLRSLPAEGTEDPGPAVLQALRAAPAKVVVLDDDPTGTQTVHGIPVLTEGSADSLRSELENDLPAFYVLTNSRSLPLPEARALNAEIGRNLKEAAARAGRRFAVVSRSDSTLRGHFPGEVEALAEAVGGGFDAWLLIPFFQEGGRYTVGDTHYVADGPALVPAGETEFARDAVFGYRSSDLREWVAEKTGGRVPASAVASVSIEDLRRGGPGRVAEKLASLSGGRVCVVNAASRRDLELFTAGLLVAEARGKRFLYRTAASFVPVRAGIPARPLLDPREVAGPGGEGGLTVVGSYVPKTTAQLEGLLGRPGIAAVEIDVARLLSEAGRSNAVARAAKGVDAALRRGEDAVVFTSRRLVTGADDASNLSIGRRVSDGLVDVVRAVEARPRYLLAKGGITSSDVATRGLGVRRAMILGQILPGVPVWKLGPETRHPGLSYIVFPGNVGGPGALAEVTAALRGPRC